MITYIRHRTLPLLAWIYLGLIIASWWWNTKLLLGGAALVCFLIFLCVASKPLWRLLGVGLVVVLCARFIQLPLPQTMSALVKLAIVVLLWGQLGTLLTIWALAPGKTHHVRPSHHK